MSILTEVKPSLSNDDLVSALGQSAEAFFEQKKAERPSTLQNLLDVFIAKVVGQTFEPFREPFDVLLSLLRNAYGQLARFVHDDYRLQASFYLGQLHALSEVANRLAHQRVPKSAMQLVLKSRVSEGILEKVIEMRSIGASELAQELGLEGSNLSNYCKPLVEHELLRKDHFGNRVRYSPTPLSYAVSAQLKDKEKAIVATVGTPSPRLRVMAVGASAGPAPDWATFSAEAAATSFAPGTNVTANIDDYVASLLTLAQLNGADGIVFDPTSQHVSIFGKNPRANSVIDLPKSISESVSEQLKAIRRANPTAVDWNGQLLTFGTRPTPNGEGVAIRFNESSDKVDSNRKARIAFQELQDGKTRAFEFEKLFITELVKSFEGQTSKAAEVLGKPQGELIIIMRGQQLQCDSLLASNTVR
jgi:DNA-binding MarR family transcriptional regulator